MQDKRIHIDEKFADHAWSEMAKLLDKEMPVQTGNSRRLAWWWWTLVAGIVIGLATILWFWGNEPMVTVSRHLPIALEGSSKSENSHEEKQGQIASPTISATSPNKVAQKMEPISIAQSQSSQGTSQAVSKKTPESRAKRLSASSASQKQETFSRQMEVIAESASDDTGSSSQHKTQESISDDIGIQKEEEIAILESTVDPLKVTTVFPSLSVPAHFPKIRQWDWGLQASGLSTINLKGVGLSTELTASRELITDGLAFQIGAGYKYLRQSIYEIQGNAGAFEAEAQDIAYANSFDKVSFDNQTTGSISSYRISSQLHMHYLEFPVEISYQIGKRISAHTGLTTSFLLVSSTKQTSNGLLTNLASNGTLLKSVDSASSLSLHDFAAIGGFGLAFTKKASIRLDFNYGLTDVIPNNGVDDFNRMLKLGFRYKLNVRN